MTDIAPRPWRRVGVSVQDANGRHILCGRFGLDQGYDRTEANLDLAVRAVNAHEALATACSRVDAWARTCPPLEMIGRFEGVLPAVRAALAQAKEAPVAQPEAGSSILGHPGEP